MSDIIIEQTTARNLMRVKVLSVYEGWSIQRLAEFFLKNDITGAPVIASDHQLVGVVSVSDIFRFENADEEVKSEALKNCYRDITGIDIVNRKDLLEWSKNAQQSCTVHQIMANDVISIDVEGGLDDVAAVMVDNDIHRVFVTEDEKIVGVISTSDILRILVRTENGAKQAAF